MRSGAGTEGGKVGKGGNSHNDSNHEPIVELFLVRLLSVAFLFLFCFEVLLTFLVGLLLLHLFTPPKPFVSVHYHQHQQKRRKYMLTS